LRTLIWVHDILWDIAWVAFIGSEYLEITGQIEEWQRLFRLHMLYEQMHMSTAKLRSIFKATDDVDKAMPMATPVLLDMQKTVDEIIAHLRLNLNKS
jgi:hypothetical protein